MAGKYSSKANSGNISYSNYTSEDLEDRLDIRLDSEIEMVQDNISKLKDQRRNINDNIDNIIDNMEGLHENSALYESYNAELGEELSDLNDIENAINLHHTLESILMDMDEGMNEFEKETMPIETIIKNMDDLNEARNDLIGEIADSGYEYW